MEFRKISYQEEIYYGFPGRWWTVAGWREVQNQPRVHALDGLYWTALARENWERSEKGWKNQ